MYSQIELTGDWVLARRTGDGYVNGIRVRKQAGSNIVLAGGAKTDFEEIEVVYAGPGHHDGRMFHAMGEAWMGRRWLVRGMKADFNEKITVKGEELHLMRGRDFIGVVGLVE